MVQIEFISRKEFIPGLLVLTHGNLETFCVNFSVWCFWSEHLFSGGDSSRPVAVFCLLALVLSCVVMEHFKLKRTNEKGSGSGPWKQPVP